MYIYIYCMYIYIYIYLIDIHSIYYIFTYQFFFILSRKKNSLVRFICFILESEQKEMCCASIPLMERVSFFIWCKRNRSSSGGVIRNGKIVEDWKAIWKHPISPISFKNNWNKKLNSKNKKKQFQANFFMPPCPKSSNSYAWPFNVLV